MILNLRTRVKERVVEEDGARVIRGIKAMLIRLGIKRRINLQHFAFLKMISCIRESLLAHE